VTTFPCVAYIYLSCLFHGCDCLKKEDKRSLLIPCSDEVIKTNNYFSRIVLDSDYLK